MNDFRPNQKIKGKMIAIHSSRGGTGKTIIATNLAAVYAKQGLNVALLDLDFRGPSLATVFSKVIRGSIKHWLNEFLDGQCTIESALIDVSDAKHLRGRLLIGVANPALDAIRNVTEKSRAWEVTAIKKLFSLRSILFKDMNVDCCIFDTSPGVQYSSLNAVISSDISVIVTTLDSLDLTGVKKILAELYEAFEKKTVIVINKAFTATRRWPSDRAKDLITRMKYTLKHPIIGVIPCYCDVLQAERTTLLAVEQPTHPFLRNLEEVAANLDEVA